MGMQLSIPARMGHRGAVVFDHMGGAHAPPASGKTVPTRLFWVRILVREYHRTCYSGVQVAFTSIGDKREFLTAAGPYAEPLPSARVTSHKGLVGMVKGADLANDVVWPEETQRWVSAARAYRTEMGEMPETTKEKS